MAILASLILTINCSKEKPGPISTENDISPSVLNHGTYGTWTVTVTNMGGEVEITRIHAREEILSGPFQGKVVETDLYVGESLIPAHEEEIVHNDVFYAFNTTGVDCQVKNTVTVYSDGGTDSDDCIYTIKPAAFNNSSSTIKTFIIHIEK